MQFYLLILHLFSVAVLIALVLIQQGKGVDMGAAFGRVVQGPFLVRQAHLTFKQNDSHFCFNFFSYKFKFDLFSVSGPFR